MKRLFDIIVCIILIILAIPVFLVTYVLIKLSSSKESPVYVQDRIGKDGRIFKFYKFRSMKTDSGDVGHREYIKEWIKENKPYAHD